jgi:hypothetical protein
MHDLIRDPENESMQKKEGQLSLPRGGKDQTSDKTLLRYSIPVKGNCQNRYNFRGENRLNFSLVSGHGNKDGDKLSKN